MTLEEQLIARMLTPADWERVVAVNLRSDVLLLAARCGPEALTMVLKSVERKASQQRLQKSSQKGKPWQPKTQQAAG